MHGAVIVSTTADKKSLLEKIARVLVEQKLAACCQIGGPVESVYRWNDKVDSAQEHLCTIKTMSSRAEEVVAKIKELHSYDEPEIVVTPIVGGSESYLKWIAESVA